MAEASEFKPLKEFGSISVTESSEIRFYVDSYKGYPYASIRTFVKRDNYTGPTRAGLTFNVAMLENIIKPVEALPAEPKYSEETELARFPKKTGIDLVVRITIYHDAAGIDFREWVDDGSYKGWSKRGIRINYSELKQIKKCIKEMLEFLRQQDTKK